MVLALPIDALLPEIVEGVRRNSILLLEAEPGAGKTTRVPPALADAGIGQVYVLEPRRLATRMAARRVAEERGDAIGETVGYQVRFEEVSSPRTRLWYCTEGVLTRKLLSGDRLRRAGVVVLDEFHERHLETDLALALLRDLQRRRTDLRIVLMSATLSGSDLSARLGDAPVFRAAGRVFPVTVQYTPHSAAPVEEQAANAVERALQQTRGHVLVFLPGAAEIRKTIAACAHLARREGARTCPLHGELSFEEQDDAVRPSVQCKIICSTNVAESSVTIEGVTAVVDSGLARVLTHSPWSGISRLQVEKISQSSAIQRAGRAGRTGPGMAIRLFPESDFVRRPVQLAPEILRADLAQPTLQLANNGLDWGDLEWLDEPPQALREHAAELLRSLGVLDAGGKITRLGEVIGALPVHPRLGRLAHEAGVRGVARAGAELAARLSEGRIRLEEGHRGNHLSDVDALLATPLLYEGRRLMQQILKGPGSERVGSVAGRRADAADDAHALDKAITVAFPDRIARRRGETLLLSNGASGRLDPQSAVKSEFLVAIEVDERGGERASVRIANPIEPDWLLDLFPDAITFSEEMTWNREAERVEQVNLIRYDKLVIDESRGSPTDAAVAAALLASKAMEGLGRFVEMDAYAAFTKRLRFAARHGLQVPGETELLERAVRTLCEGLSSFRELQTAARENALLSLFQSFLPMTELEEIAPASVRLPSGRRAKIEYHDDRPPSVASRLQDFFGMAQSPSVARGTVPLVVELLAPNHRPVQVTKDLASFWKGLYPQVRKELSRRYPRHAWPEDPV